MCGCVCLKHMNTSWKFSCFSFNHLFCFSLRYVNKCSIRKWKCKNFYLQILNVLHFIWSVSNRPCRFSCRIWWLLNSSKFGNFSVENIQCVVICDVIPLIVTKLHNEIYHWYDLNDYYSKSGFSIKILLIDYYDRAPRDPRESIPQNKFGSFVDLLLQFDIPKIDYLEHTWSTFLVSTFYRFCLHLNQISIFFRKSYENFKCFSHSTLWNDVCVFCYACECMSICIAV